MPTMAYGIVELLLASLFRCCFPTALPFALADTAVRLIQYIVLTMPYVCLSQLLPAAQSSLLRMPCLCAVHLVTESHGHAMMRHQPIPAAAALFTRPRATA